MRIIDPHASAITKGEIDFEKGHRKASGMQKAKQRAADYMEKMHLYEHRKGRGHNLVRGEKKVMTGEQAKTINEIWMDRFKAEVSAQLDAGVEVTAEIEKWSWLKDVEVPQQYEENEFHTTEFAKIIVFLRNCSNDELNLAYWLAHTCLKTNRLQSKSWVDTVRLKHLDGTATVSHWP